MRQDGKALGVGAMGDFVEPQGRVLDNEGNAGVVGGSRTLGVVHELGQVFDLGGLVGDAGGQLFGIGGPGRASYGMLLPGVTAVSRSSHIIH